jgi:hypothetical protein
VRPVIDKASGDIVLDTGESIGPALTRQGFLASLLGAGASPLAQGGSASTFHLGLRGIGGHTLGLRLGFEGEPLCSVTLSMAQPDDSSSWDDWSEGKELARKARHDAWLEAQLGPLPWWFSWGDVTSDYDPRGGSSEIRFAYCGQASAVAARRAAADANARTVAIDSTVGEVVFDAGERIGPGLTLTAFLASPLARGSSRSSRPGTPWSAFPVDVRLQEGGALTLTVYFEGEALRHLTISITGEHEPPATDYRQHWGDDAALAQRVRDDELARKARHDAWLDKQLGLPPWSFSWGAVSSSYDATFCQSLVSVVYR